MSTTGVVVLVLLNVGGVVGWLFAHYMHARPVWPSERDRMRW